MKKVSQQLRKRYLIPCSALRGFSLDTTDFLELKTQQLLLFESVFDCEQSIISVKNEKERNARRARLGEHAENNTLRECSCILFLAEIRD